MLRRWFALAGMVLLLVPSVLAAQSRWDITVQGGAAFPTKSLSNADLDAGVGFEGTVGYQVYGPLTAYAGWGWHRFTSKDLATPFRNGAANVVQTGYVFGLRYSHELQGRGLRPTLVARAGGTLEHLETKTWSGTMTEDTGHGLGGELGVALGLTLANHWSVMPGLRFRSLRRDLTIDGLKRPARLDYLTLEAGVNYAF
ncbi:MAG: outer membrane beta-barrel protein [Gemmatimonadales bacterium]